MAPHHLKEKLLTHQNPCRKFQLTSHVDPVPVQHPVFTHGLNPDLCQLTLRLGDEILSWPQIPTKKYTGLQNSLVVNPCCTIVIKF